MRFQSSRLFSLIFGVSAVCAGIAPVAEAGGPPPTPASDHARIVAHWTPERIAAAIPRDLVIDERGQGYLRRPDGSLEPYGHTVAAAAPVPMAKPVNDGVGPVIGDLDPTNHQTIGGSYTFNATVTDPAGVRSVTFNVRKEGYAWQSFSAAKTAGDVWVVSLQGFTEGTWSWQVVAKDAARNPSTSDIVTFQVSLSGGGGGGGGSSVITNAEWTGGNVQYAAGRIYFEMPSNSRRTRWVGYVCSGTVATDGTPTRSIILTAAHCVYDDANKAFARNVMFIPNQAGTSLGAGTDRDCDNDPIGCWTAAFGVVDVNWTSRTFPTNVEWDYGYYVVHDTGAHQPGLESAEDALDEAAGSLGLSFNEPKFDVADDTDYTHALGYSYSYDPHFMYCAEDLHDLDSANWWLGNCGLSGGSSGGPWIQPMDVRTGSGPIISVNSWGYTNQPGMAGPKLSGRPSAKQVFACAQSADWPTSTVDGNAGRTYGVDCP